MKSWQKNIRRVEPYVPGEQPRQSRLIKLNTNENPYPPSPAVEKALKEMDPELLRKYPDPGSSILTEALAAYHGVDPEQVFVGVGSDDVIGMAFLTFFNSELPVLFPDISYSFYPVWAQLFEIPYETPALDEEFRIRPQDYKRENGGIIFPNPNAPTGLYLPLDQVEEIIAANQDSVVILDEAYIDFGGRSALELVETYDNLLVTRTFSKSRSMAGMRIGYAIGSRELIQALNDVKYSYNSYTMNLPAQILGAASVRDEEYFCQTRDKIIATRERSKARMRELGFTFPDSMSNFLLATHGAVPAQELFEALKAAKIYVRYFKLPRLDNSLRITIGTDEEMDQLFAFLEEYLDGRT